MFKRGSRSLSVLVVFCLVCLYAVPAMAEAQQHNNIVVVGGDTALSVGATGTATVYLEEDGNRCNAGVVAVMINAFGSAVVSVTSSVILTDCGQANGQQITYKANAEGVATITAWADGGKQNSTYTEGSLTVTVGPAATPNTPPTVTVPDDIEFEGDTLGGRYVTFEATATDTEDGDLDPECTPPSGSLFPVGTTTVTCKATDVGGEIASASFTVTITDETPPAFIDAPDDIVVPGTSAACAAVSWNIAAYDVVDGDVDVDCDPESGSTFPFGTTKVTCTATDNHENGATHTFNVTVTYSWSGLLPPIKTPLQTFNKNQTIPVKFQLTGASTGITDLHATLETAPGPDGTDYKPAASVGKANDSNVFRYDPAADQYVFNLDAKSLGTGTFSLKVDLGDGVAHTLDIVIK